MDNAVDKQKTRLEQRKNRLAAEEVKLKLKERKARTRHLIELGSLLVKANIDLLPTDTLYGALLSLSSLLEDNPNIMETWAKLGKSKLEQEQSKYTAVILQFEDEPDKNIRDILRNHGMRWNKFRKEWYGSITDLDKLKEELGSIEFTLEVIDV